MISEAVKLVLLNPVLSFIENTVDPDHLTSDKAIRSGLTLLSTLSEVLIAVMLHYQRKQSGEKCSTKLFSMTSFNP